VGNLSWYGSALETNAPCGLLIGDAVDVADRVACEGGSPPQPAAAAPNSVASAATMTTRAARPVDDARNLSSDLIARNR
jgi:hypothetical protein